MPSSFRQPAQNKQALPRRRFLHTIGKVAGAIACSLALPTAARAATSRLSKPVRLGLIADLHHDVMHDAPARLAAFLKEMAVDPPDAIIQLGDFAQAKEKNRALVKQFRDAHPVALHVIGNHDTDSGISFDQLLKEWGMKSRYYKHDIKNLRLLVLDGNETPPDHKGGYPSYVGPKQIEWLQKELGSHDGPFLIFCHQPLAGPFAIKNSEQVQKILNGFADQIILTINGHTHIDDLIQTGDVAHLHVNSASYQWVGGNHRHLSYPAEIHAANPWIEYTCPYRDPLFTTLTFDPDSGEVQLEGRKTAWVGKSPEQVGVANQPGVIDGQQVVAEIRPRKIPRKIKQ
ncbi:MAG: metallophosphoesterase [Planctomycetota bacterium]|nr:metallophosphoesterase [Planctomycetota bacterium]